VPFPEVSSVGGSTPGCVAVAVSPKTEFLAAVAMLVIVSITKGLLDCGLILPDAVYCQLKVNVMRASTDDLWLGGKGPG
jgi:hypothetical protein